MGIRQFNSPKYTILVAEDSEDEFFLLNRHFKSASAQPEAELRRAHDGEEAIHYLQGRGEFADREAYPIPTVLLLDVKMPRKNGFEVLAWVRAHEQLGNLVVVMLSSSDDPRDVDQAYRLGANSYLAKASLDRQPNAVNTLKQYWLRLNELPSVSRPLCCEC